MIKKQLQKCSRFIIKNFFEPLVINSINDKVLEKSFNQVLNNLMIPDVSIIVLNFNRKNY